MYESRILWNLMLPLKYLFKGKFMNAFRLMMHNHVWVSKRPAEVLDKSVRSEASGGFVNSRGRNRRLLWCLESGLKAMPFGGEQVLQHLRSFTRLGGVSTARLLGEPGLVWQVPGTSGKQGTAFGLTLAHQQDQAVAVSPRSMNKGFCGTWCEEWGQTGAAMVPLLAPSAVSWGERSAPVVSTTPNQI